MYSSETHKVYDQGLLSDTEENMYWQAILAFKSCTVVVPPYRNIRVMMDSKNRYYPDLHMTWPRYY